MASSETPRVGVFGMNMKKYIDAHCHLFDFDLPDNLGAVVNATRVTDWENVVNKANNNPNIWGAIGVHPWFVSELDVEWDAKLCDLLRKNPEIAVGEIGLDKYKSDMNIQIGVFLRQLEIAVNLGRGVHVHCVGAWDKMFSVLKNLKSGVPPFVLFHRFSGNSGDVARVMSYCNAYFSFCDVRDVVSFVPRERVLIETDSDNPCGVIGVADRFSQICTDCDFYENTMEMLKNG